EGARNQLGDGLPRQRARVDARRRLSRRAQADHGHVLDRNGRAVDVARQGGQGRPAHEARGSARRFGPGLLSGRALPLFFGAHGVFPGFAWTPDGRAIVATAEGKIWRWDASTGARTAIPFTAAVEQRVTAALRFPHRLGGDSLRARILRWPVESPDGKRLVFS